MCANTITFTVTIYRVEICGTVHRQTFENFQEVIVVESFIETAYKGFIDALLLSPSSWSSIVVHEVRYNVC